MRNDCKYFAKRRVFYTNKIKCAGIKSPLWLWKGKKVLPQVPQFLQVPQIPGVTSVIWVPRVTQATQVTRIPKVTWAGLALGIWISKCRPFYRREPQNLWVQQVMSQRSTGSSTHCTHLTHCLTGDTATFEQPHRPWNLFIFKFKNRMQTLAGWEVLNLVLHLK